MLFWSPYILIAYDSIPLGSCTRAPIPLQDMLYLSLNGHLNTFNLQTIVYVKFGVRLLSRRHCGPTETLLCYFAMGC